MTHISPQEALAQLPDGPTVHIGYFLDGGSTFLTGDIETKTIREAAEHGGAWLVDDARLLAADYTIQVDLGWNKVYVKDRSKS